MSDNNVNGKDFLLGAVIGGLIGIAGALLLAPKSGKELRSEISEQYHQASEKTQELAGTISQKSQEIAKNVTAQTTELVGKAKEVIGTVTGEVKAVWKDIKNESLDSEQEIAAAMEYKEE